MGENLKQFYKYFKIVSIIILKIDVCMYIYVYANIANYFIL